MGAKYVLGLDYGSDSVRAVLVDVANGEEVATDVCLYPRWNKGLYCDPAANQFRQHPLDYLESLKSVIDGTMANAPAGAADAVVAISIDTTGSTPVAVDQEGTALSLKPEFAENPNAMFVLWKDHTALKEADEINALAKSWGGEDYTKYEGGIYSSEWFWAKVLHVLRADNDVRDAAFSWVEHCDWLPALLTGTPDPLTLKRGRCSAGHKAMWHESWGGLPAEEFLVKLDPMLAGLRDRLYTDTYTSEVAAGQLTEEWAAKLNLPAGIPVGVGAFDAHMGAVGANIRQGTMTKIMGTSTCDIVVATEDEIDGRLIKGICGQVDGSVVPGLIGLEAGQSGFGDVYAWFRKMINGPAEQIIRDSDKVPADQKEALIEEIHDNTLKILDQAAGKIEIGASGVTALDWVNGRRTPDANQNLKAAISGISMGSDAVRIYKALVEATAFGSRKIIERFESEGVPITDVVALGGIAKKSKFVMQVCADVINLPIEVVGSDQCCALGAAMFAATMAGVYRDVPSAQEAMCSPIVKKYEPNAASAEQYNALYEEYCTLGQFVEDQL